MPLVKNNLSINDIRILKILSEYGPLNRRDLGTKFIDHMEDRNLTGSLNNARLIYLLNSGYVKAEAVNSGVGLPETVYTVVSKHSLDEYIEQI